MAQDPRPNTSDLVLADIEDDGIGVITLNRVERRNALSTALIDSLLAVFARLDCDDTIRVIVLTSVPGSPFSGMSAMTKHD